MESEYKKYTIFANLILGYFFLTFTGFISFMLVRKFILFPDDFSLSKITFACISILIFAILTASILLTALIRNQYYQNNLNYFLELDKTKKALIIHFKQNSNPKYVNFDEVKYVKLYYSWNTNPFSSDLGYSKIILNDGSFYFVTQNNINQYHIYRAFENKISVNKSRFANPLK